MKVPALEINLPEWQESDFRLIKEAEKNVSAIARGAGKGSDEFKNACRRLLKIVLRGDQSGLREAITRAIDVRAFTYLLSSSDDFAKLVSVSRNLLDGLLIPRSPLSKLSLVQMIRAFFVRFDTIVSQEAMRDWCEFIKSQLVNVNAQSGSSDILRYAKYAVITFSPNGPSRIVSYAKSNELDFDGVLKRLGLTGFSDGRFLTLCRYQYYLDTLKTIPVGSDNPVLAEVVKTDVVNAPFSMNKQLGHAILEVLIDRSEGRPLSQSWQSTILTIAGDPRVPKSGRNYQQWWALLGEKRIALMRGWLSRFDLKLFLKVLEQSAKDGSNSDMERMFESRKIFMEGLLKQGLVAESRLLLSGHAEHYLKRHYDKNELPEYARVASQQTSMIYLNLAGKVHMIEGSHSFKLKLFDRVPSKVRISDYGVKAFSDSDLRAGIGFQYNREFGDHEGYSELTHDIYLGWQNKAIEFLRGKGLSVETAQLISNNRYREYKSKFGAI